MPPQVSSTTVNFSHITSSTNSALVTQQIDLLVSLHLHLWDDLTYAVQNAWGGSPQLCADKRDWLAGAISDLITPEPETLKSRVADDEDLEDVLAQVMLDEFEVVIDDESCEEIASAIWKGREKVLKGDFSEVEQLKKKWENRGARKVVFQKGEQDENAQDTDEDADEDPFVNDLESNGFADSDVEMDQAPSLVDTKHSKPEPEVDHDGFTKVVRKKR